MRSNEISFSSESLIEIIKETFAKNSSFKFKVSGWSMSPFIKDGDIVTISPLSKSKISFGRSVAFIHPVSKKLTIHRIIGSKNSYFLIKGDASVKFESLIPRENILGIVTRVEREGRDICGLNYERFIIAFLSKKGFLPFILAFWRLIPLSIRRFIKCKIGL